MEKSVKVIGGILEYECLECGAVVPGAPPPPTAKFGEPGELEKCNGCGSYWLSPVYDYKGLDKTFLSAPGATGASGMWRYSALLPAVASRNIVTLSEGGTPLVRLKGIEKATSSESIFVKDERSNPTGSFKDRQASLAVSLFREWGIDRVAIASTGNVAASFAAYSARAGIALWVFMPVGSDELKASEAAGLGAKIVMVDGTYDRAKEEALSFARERGMYYDHGGRSVHTRESMKTIAFEIAGQLGCSPDWYVQPVSGGIGPLGVWQGFEDLKKMALVDKVPRIACVQSEGCAPMALAFEKGLATAPAVVPATAIPALATGDPGYAYTLLRRRLERTGGVITSVPDARAFEVMEELGESDGQKMSPAAAVGFAGLLDLIDRGVIGRRSVVVVNCTGAASKRF